MTERTNGRFRFKVAFRELADDRGLAIHVFGPTSNSSEEEEVLRFDCFENQPHYHLAWSYRNDPLIPIEASNPFEWAIDKLANDIKTLLVSANASPMDDQELRDLKELLSFIQSHGKELADAA
jgi:hypothetical protein